jgi:hypothetical protein
MGKQSDLGRMTKGSDKSYDRMENKKAAGTSDSTKGNQPNKVSSIEHVGSSGAHGVRFKLPEDAACTDHSVVTRSKLGA